MKKLLSTTALVMALCVPAMTLAQTATQTTTGAETVTTPSQSAGMSAFLAAREPSDLFASELIGQDVYARRTQEVGAGSDDQTTMSADGTAAARTNADEMHDTAEMRRADLDGMDNIGQINEIVLSSDGRVRALVIGVGGFLGIGEQDVAVTMDQVTFAADPDDRALVYIVVDTGAEMLRESPAYERSVMTEDTAAMNEETTAPAEDASALERTAFTAPDLEREGYTRVAATEVSTEVLLGETVYGVNDENVGTVADLILDDAGTITDVIIDFGGFLGIGSSQVSVGFDELTIMTNEGNTDLRIYIDATEEQVQSQPEYHASN